MSAIKKGAENREIGDFCQTGSGGTPSRRKLGEYFGGSIPWVKSGELRENVITTTKETITEAGLSSSSAKLVPQGALLVALYGATVGRIGMLGIEAATNQAVCYIIPDQSIADRQYLFYAMQNSVPSWLSQRVGGGQPNISQGVIKSTKIPLPPLSEQKRIADILDKADAIRRKRQQAIEEAAQITSSMFFEEFGDPLHNPKDWPLTILSDVCTKITDGVHFKPEYTESGVPFISVKDITTGKLKFEAHKWISEEAHEKYIKRCNPEFHDILYTKVGATYGRPAIVDTKKEFSIYVSVALIKPNHEMINAKYLKEVLASHAMKRQADRSIKGAGVPDLHLVEIRKFKLPLPPMKVQKDFVERCEQVHQIEARLKAAAIESNSLFNSLVQRAFKGEL